MEVLEYSYGGGIERLDGVRLRAPSHSVVTQAKTSAAAPLQIYGYATRYKKPHVHKGRIEFFLPGCFDETLKAGGLVRFVEDHEDGATFATSNGGGLKLVSDDVGLAFLADLPDNSEGRRAHHLVASHRKSAMSVRYRPKGVRESLIAGEAVFVIHNAALEDISLCNNGAVKETYAQIATQQMKEPDTRSSASADCEAAFERLYRQCKKMGLWAP